MMANKKFSFNFYQVFENDALRDYLEHMSLKGWRLTKISSMLLHFEACEPHSIRYCVEVMEKPSTYASNQTLPLKRYREFCRDAGWNYIGTNGLLHIFYTEDTDAVPVETDAQERFERICSACRGNNRMMIILFVFIGLMNLISCRQKGTLLCTQGFIACLLLFAGFYAVGDFQLWKHRAQASLADKGTLPCLSWASVKTKNMLGVTVSLALCISFLLFTFAKTSSAAIPYLLIYLVVYIIMMIVFSGLLHWLREKKNYGRGTNILIYWSSVVFMIILFVVILSVALRFFLNNY